MRRCHVTTPSTYPEPRTRHRLYTTHCTDYCIACVDAFKPGIDRHSSMPLHRSTNAHSLTDPLTLALATTHSLTHPPTELRRPSFRSRAAASAAVQPHNPPASANQVHHTILVCPLRLCVGPASAVATLSPACTQVPCTSFARLLGAGSGRVSGLWQGWCVFLASGRACFGTLLTPHLFTQAKRANIVTAFVVFVVVGGFVVQNQLQFTTTVITTNTTTTTMMGSSGSSNIFSFQ